MWTLLALRGQVSSCPGAHCSCPENGVGWDCTWRRLSKARAHRGHISLELSIWEANQDSECMVQSPDGDYFL